MDVEQFESICLTVGLTTLIGYMFFIMYKLAKDSNAGKFGAFVIFGALGLGVLGFVIKEIIIYSMKV